MCLSSMKTEFLPKFSINLSDQYISIIVTMLLKSMSAAGWFWVLGPPGTPVNTCTNIMLGSQFWTDKQKYQCSKYIHIQKNRVVGFNVSCHKNVTSCGVVGICAPTDGSFPMLLLLISTSYTHRAVVCSRLFLSRTISHLSALLFSLSFIGGTVPASPAPPPSSYTCCGGSATIKEEFGGLFHNKVSEDVVLSLF